MTGAPALTVVVPAFNESSRLPVALPMLVEYLSRWPGAAELLVVDDGSTDATATVAAELLGSMPLARLVKLRAHRGKGAAVRAGMAEAQGDAVAFMDADLATHLDCLEPLIAALESSEVAIGSRSMVGADIRWRSRWERARHTVFARLVRAIAGIPVADSQCGFKAMTAATSSNLVKLSTEDGYAFDVELLALAQSRGWRIVEVPVRWTARSGGHVKAWRDAPAMVVRTMAIRARVRRTSPDGGPAKPAPRI